MSRVGAAFLTAFALASSPVVADTMTATPTAAAVTAAPHRIAREAAWGCRDKKDVLDLLFQGMSVTFDDKLATALADGRCVVFKSGEDVVVVDPAANGLVRVQRPGATPVAYWTAARNVE